MIHNASINPDRSVSYFVRRTYFLKVSGVSSPRGFIYNVTESGSEGKLKSQIYTTPIWSGPTNSTAAYFAFGGLEHNYQ